MNSSSSRDATEEKLCTEIVSTAGEALLLPCISGEVVPFTSDNRESERLERSEVVEAFCT